jgi:hypothetical protein
MASAAGVWNSTIIPVWQQIDRPGNHGPGRAAQTWADRRRAPAGDLLILGHPAIMGLVRPAWVQLITVPLRLAPDEPEASPWRAERLTVVADTVMRLGRGQGAGHSVCGHGVGHRPVVLAVDGRSSSGKTTLAARLRDVVSGSAVVHTDDIAWWHSRFGWADLLIDGILTPAHAGRPVSFRPAGWVERERPGAIEVPAGCLLLIIEGVGAARRECAHLIDAAVWVQSDERETERRNLARVGQPGESPTVQHMRDWMAEEVPFLADQRPWGRADLIACGTPEIPFVPATELVVASAHVGIPGHA